MNHRLIVVDDASDAHTRETVRELVAEGWGDQGTVLVNEHNLGFLQTANRGMCAGDREVVVLLNSDTLVAPGWLEGLLAALRQAPDVGIVSPLSNNANLTRIAVPYGSDHLQLAEAVRLLSPRAYPEIRLATGFCLATWRRLLEELDFFDEHYGRGYFEEADLCLRAAERGWRTLADDGTYVHHHGWGSFGAEERSVLMDRNAELFRARWNLDHGRLRRQILRRRLFAEHERRIRIALSDGAQTRPRRRLPRSGTRNVAESARLAESRQERGRRRVPTSTRYALQVWERIALEGEEGPPTTAGELLVICDDLDVTPWTTDLLQLADRLRQDGLQVSVATSGVFDTTLFTDPCRLRPFVLSGPDELLSVVPPHRVVVATSPATVFDALLLRERDGSRVATWFEHQAPAPRVGWPGDGWNAIVAPRLAQAHLGASVPGPAPEGVDVFEVPLGVDGEVYVRRKLADRGARILVTHDRDAGSRATDDVRRAIELLHAEGLDATVYGDAIPGLQVESAPLAPQSVEASLLAQHLALLEIAPVPGLDRLRLRCASTGTPVVLAGPTSQSCPLAAGSEAFVAPRGDVDRAVEIAATLVGQPAMATAKADAAYRRAQAAPVEAEVRALATAVMAIAARDDR